jgi:tetratricopeptide (TPR) repeat protein
VAGGLLHALERKGFLTRQRRSSVESEGEWAFAHMLLRDVAYGQIPRGERAEKHRLVAEWIESLGRPEDHGEMLAHHWRAALELARAAGRDGGDLAERTRLALRGAGDRAFALNAYDPAEGYYEEALALWPPDDDERPDLLFRRAHALHLAGDERREPALEEARDALIAAGNPEAAGEAAAFLARAAWHRGGRDESFSHLASAEELVAAAPASAAKARVLATSARQRTLAGEPQEGIRLAEQALELAQRFGLAELEAHALTTIGTAKLQREPDAMSYLERGLEIALAANSPEAATILINLAVGAFFGGDVRREDELFGEAYLMAERFGDLDTLRFSRGDRIWTRWALGHWDEAGQAAEQFIAECESSPHYLESSAREIRAYLRLARGDRDGALEDYQRGLELARQIKDLQALLPGLVHSAHGLALLGKLDEAQALAREALELAGEHVGSVAILSVLNPVARQLGLRQQVRDLVEQAPDGPWKEVALAGVGGDFSRAADLFAAYGAQTFEAEARLCAAEQLIEGGRRAEGEAELQRALAFYRKVGATRYVQQGEALLAASA